MNLKPVTNRKQWLLLYNTTWIKVWTSLGIKLDAWHTTDLLSI